MTEIPKYAKEWAKAPLNKNTKTPIKNFKKADKKTYSNDFWKEHFRKGGLWGFYACYGNPIVVIDYDCRTGKKADFLGNLQQDTLRIESKHGFHEYYEIIDDIPKKQIHNKNVGFTTRKQYKANLTKLPDLLNGIDIQANALVVGQNSIHKGFTYKRITDFPIKKITRKIFDSIVSGLFLKEPKTIRDGFSDVLFGITDPHDITQKTGILEFLYWKNTYFECIWSGLTRNTILDIFEAKCKKNSFKRETFESMLDYKYNHEKGFWIDKNGKEVENQRLGNEKYKNYFPNQKTQPKKQMDKKPIDIDDLIENLDIDDNDQLEYVCKIVNSQFGALKGKYLNKLKQKTKIAKKYLETTETEVINVYHEIESRLREVFEIVSYKNEILIKIDNAYTTQLDKLITHINELAKEYKFAYRYIKSDILESLKDSKIVDPNFFCYEAWIMSFKDGYYDFIKNEFVKSVDCIKEFVFAINREFPKNESDCPKFKNALNTWLKGNELITKDDIFEFMAYSLMFGNFLKAFFLNVGFANTGKTQILEVLKAFIPSANRIGISLHRLTSDHFGSWGLDNKILCHYDDISDRVIYDLDMIKSITGGSSEISIEAKHGKKHDSINMAKIWQNGNYIPRIDNSNDVAYLDRVIIIEFLNVIDRNVKGFHKDQFYLTITENEPEMNGILTEIIKAGKRLIKRGNFRKEVKDYSKNYYIYKSDEIYAFIQDNCVMDIYGQIDFIKAKELINLMRFERQKPRYSSQELRQIFEKRGIYKDNVQRDGKKTYILKGLRWNRESRERNLWDMDE